MAKKVNLKLREQIWHLYCNDTNQTRIAEELKVPQQTVSWHINKLKGDINYRLNVKCIEEFAEYRLRMMDSLELEIAEVTKQIEKFEKLFEFEVALKYREYRKSLKLDLYEVMGDGEAVLALRRKMLSKDGISQEAPKGT